MRTAILVVTLAILAAGCGTFGAMLPPGAAGGSFLDEAKGIVPLKDAARAHQRALDDAERAHVDANVEVFRGLREDARRLREDLKKGAADLVAEDGRETIGPDDVRRVRDIARRYLELDALLYALWTTYRDHLPYRSEPDPYAPMRAATLLSPATRETGGLLALAAELERLDNAAMVVQTLAPHHALTRFLNRGDEKLELAPESFDRCVGALYDPDHRALLERQLEALLDERERLSARAATDERVAVLLETIQGSGTGRAIIDESDGRRRLVFLWNVVSRSALDAAGPFLDGYIAAGFVEEARALPPPPTSPPP